MASALQSYATPNPNGSNDYMTAFQNALQSARGGIQQQLGVALNDINQNRQAAQGALGQLGPGIDQAYGALNSTQNAAQNAISGAQQRSGIGSLNSLQTYMQPARAAANNSQAYLKSEIPLLGLGIQQQASQQQNAAQMAGLSDNNALNQSAMGQYGSMASSLQGYNQNMGLQKNQQDFTAGQNKLYPPGGSSNLQNQLAPGALGSQFGMSVGDTNTMRATPQYKNVAAAIAKGSVSPADLSRMYGSKNPQLLRVLMNDFSGYFKGK